MRLAAFFLAAFSLAAGVAGSGRRTTYEKLMLFDAYLIEKAAGVPLDQRRFGVKCARAPLYENGPCPDPAPPAPKYTHCRINEWINDPDDPAGVQRIQRTRDCESLPEFMAHLDNVAHYRNRGFVADHGRPQTDLDFDVVNAAERIEALRNDRLRPPPWRMYKEGSDPGHYAEDDNGRRVATYNGFLESTFNYMVRLKANMTPEQHNAIRGRFGHFEAARFQLSRARQADADHHWMNEIQRRNPGIVPVYEDLGYQDGVYTNHPRPARLYDHERTIANHVGRMPDIAEQLQRYRVDFMRNDLGRRNHAAVMGRIENGAQLLGHTDAGCLLP